MRNLKEYLGRFVKDENGFEFLQVAIIIVLVAGLAGVIGIIIGNVTQKANAAADSIMNIDTNAWQGGTP